MNRALRLLVSSFFCLSLFVSDQALAISGGLSADSARFDFVRVLWITLDDGTHRQCTGSMINYFLVLTAAHCVEFEEAKLKSIEVRLSPSDRNGVLASLASVHRRFAFTKDSKGELLGLQHDVAILVLKTTDEPDLSKQYAMTPLGYLWERYKAQHDHPWLPDFEASLNANDVRKVFDENIQREKDGRVHALAMGFGYMNCSLVKGRCDTLSDQPYYIGKYLGGWSLDGGPSIDQCDYSFVFISGIRLICSKSDLQSTTVERNPNASSDTPFDSEQGDSGGPVFVFDKEGRPILVGVVSFGSVQLGGFMTSLSEEISFLREVEDAPHGEDESLTFSIGERDVRPGIKIVARESFEFSKSRNEVFGIYENFDIESHVFSNLNADSLSVCQQACIDDEQCKSATFDKWNRKCYLKDNIGQLRKEPKAISIAFNKGIPPISHAAPLIERYRNRVFPGKPYSQSTNVLYNSCEQACLGASDCLAFSYFKAARQCLLFDRGEEYHSDKDVDSGAKRQPALP